LIECFDGYAPAKPCSCNRVFYGKCRILNKDQEKISSSWLLSSKISQKTYGKNKFYFQKQQKSLAQQRNLFAETTKNFSTKSKKFKKKSALENSKRNLFQTFSLLKKAKPKNFLTTTTKSLKNARNRPKFAPCIR
jgi:hypothetical protein